MADEEEKSFRVMIEDCQRWSQRFQRMAKALEQKQHPGKDTDDNMKMFLTASVLMQKLGLEIQEEKMFSETSSPFGLGKIGEA